MSLRAKAHQMAHAGGASSRAMAQLGSKETMLLCLRMADIELDIVADVAEACELSSIDVVTLASQVVPIDKLAELAFLTASEAEVRAFLALPPSPTCHFRAVNAPLRGSVACTPLASTRRRHGHPLQPCGVSLGVHWSWRLVRVVLYQAKLPSWQPRPDGAAAVPACLKVAASASSDGHIVELRVRGLHSGGRLVVDPLHDELSKSLARDLGRDPLDGR